MTSSNDPPGGSAGQPGQRRPPTIDLKATEVDSGSSVGAEPSPGSETPRERAGSTALSPGLLLPLAAAGILGALVTLAIVGALGLLSPPRDNVSATIDTRLAQVEQQARSLAAKPAPVMGDAKAVDELAGRLTRLETQLATPQPPTADPAMANRIATLEGDLKALGERIGAVGRRNDEISTAANEARKRADAAAAALTDFKKAQASAASDVQRTDLDALATRVAALEQAAKALEAQLGARANTDNPDRSLRRVLVANALTAAVERGVPFMAELAAAKAAAPDPKALAALEPFAKSGVPSADALARELTALVPALVKATGASTRDTGILDRLMANAEKVVRVRPVDEATGDDLITVLQRIEVRARQGNLAGAMADIAKLPEPARALTKEWEAKVAARNAAIEASRKFSADALAAIGKPSP